MDKLNIRGKDLRSIGFPQGPVISLAINLMNEHFPNAPKQQVLEKLQQVAENPGNYESDPVFGKVARALLPTPVVEGSEISLNETGIPVNIFGAQFIEQGALDQMTQASRLPVSVAGALMPDAHSGYGLPIGGVLATEKAVIPFGVGVDIGCRMCLSIFDINPGELLSREQFFTRELNENTLFGAGKEFKRPVEHEVIYRKEFNESGLLKSLQATAARQLGSSGSGNHFVEFGVVEIFEHDETLAVAPGKYLGLLSHSGSRGLGANIANHFTRIARQKRKLPTPAVNLAWFELTEEEGIQYWTAMNLAGDYAAACHHVIHEKISTQLGRQAIKRVENHHNFAWKEVHEGKEVIVHRKGATPAGAGVLGIIPGSMTAPGFIVKGKGEETSLASASHGAGRKMSRSAALKSFTHQQLKDYLKSQGVKLIGGGLDEAPQAYKDIEVIMQSQRQLVDVLGKFYPRIVKMDR